MKSRVGTRLWWLVVIAAACLPASPGFAVNRVVFHLARVDYVGGASDCENPASPIAKLIKSSGGDAAQLQILLATKLPKNDECAQRVRAEIMLATKVVEYLLSEGIAVIFHLDEAPDLEQQLGKIRSPNGDPFLIHCAFIPNDSNANQLDITCTIKRLHGDCVGAKSWHHDKPPMDKLVDLFNEETSENVSKLCKGQMQSGQQARH
jgi:hypothetical protein